MSQARAQRDCAPQGDAPSAARRGEAERLPGSSKQQEVLDVASRYFLRHGFEGASINAMARSSGISKESIYRYFSSKQELFEAVIDRELIEYQGQLECLDSNPTTIDLREALVAIARAILGVITDEKTMALRRLVFVQATRTPELGRYYFQIGPEQAYAKLREIFAEHDAGNGAFDCDSLSRHFIALISHRIMLERECRLRSEPTPEEVREMSERLVEDFLKAFLREK
jgi:TetR/AcrR family transcriptional repressor of mexJK operon